MGIPSPMYKDISYNIPIKMAAALVPSGDHVVTFTPPVGVTINSGSTMAFDSSNWNTPQNLNVTGTVVGSKTISGRVTAPYHLAAHHLTHDISLSILPLPPDVFIGSAFTAFVQPSTNEIQHGGDLAVYHVSVGGGDPGFTISDQVVFPGSSPRFKVVAPDGTTTYTTFGRFDMSSQAGTWAIYIGMDFYFVDQPTVGITVLESQSFKLYQGFSGPLGPLMDTSSSYKRPGIIYTRAVVMTGTTAGTYSVNCYTIVDDSSNGSLSFGNPVAFTGGDVASSCAAAGTSVTITDTRGGAPGGSGWTASYIINGIVRGTVSFSLTLNN